MAPLNRDDLEKFARIGVEPALLAAARVERLGDLEARKHGFSASIHENLSGILFVYYSLENQPVSARLRRDDPDGENGREKKYVSLCRDSATRYVYLPPDAKGKLVDPLVTILAVEAEKATLSLTLWAERNRKNILVIGLGGCWGWRSRSEKKMLDGRQVNESGVVAGLETVTRGREVIILFDANAATNPAVKRARRELAHTLATYDARVKIASLPIPPADGEQWNGPDDFWAVAHDEGLSAIIDAARPTAEVIAQDAEEAIAATQKADASQKAGEVIRAAEIVAQVANKVEREALIARLAQATHRLVSKLTITEMVADLIRRNSQEHAELEERISRARIGEVDGEVLIGKIEEFLKRYFILRTFYYPILATWIVFTYVFQVFDFAAYIVVVSPTKRCGKSNLLAAMSLLSCKAWKVVSPSVSSLFRKIDSQRCPLFLDEGDASFKGPGEFRESLRAILNAGFEVHGVVSRCVGGENGRDFEVKDFVVGGPKALASIQDLPDTVMDRSVVVRISRKTRKETVARFRSRVVRPETAVLKKEIEVWAAGVVKDIAFDVPQPIEELHDRAWDVVEPLVTLAARISPEFDARLRDALKAAFQVGAESGAEEDTIATKLLADIREVFPAKEEKIRSGELVSRLKNLENSPWSGWNDGKGLSTNGLARLLRPFEIYPRQQRYGDETFKGYAREWFDEAFERYLSSQESGNISPSPEDHFQPKQSKQPNKDAGETSFSQPKQDDSVSTSKNASDPHKQRIVSDVSVESSPSGEAIDNNGSDTPGDGDDGFVDGEL